MWSEHRYVSFDGTPLFFRHLRPGPRFKAAVLIQHGMGEHGGRYTELAEFLASCGFSCYLPDLRGFGVSGGKRGCLREFTDYFQDLQSVFRLMRSWEEDPDPFLVGHSYGGLVLSSFLAADSAIHAKGLVLTSPNFGLSLKVPIWRGVLAQLASRIWPDYTQDNRVAADLLTHDPQKRREHAQDRLIHGRISARLYTELVRQYRSARQTASSLTMPCLILQAGDDRIVSRQATDDFYRTLGSKDKQLKVLDGLFHEILNETSRRTLYQEIADWLLRHS